MLKMWVSRLIPLLRDTSSSIFALGGCLGERMICSR